MAKNPPPELSTYNQTHQNLTTSSGNSSGQPESRTNDSSKANSPECNPEDPRKLMRVSSQQALLMSNIPNLKQESL